MLRQKGYHQVICQQCGLTSWSKVPAPYCGNAVCYPYDKTTRTSTITPRQLRSIFHSHFTQKDHSAAGVKSAISLRRASTITRYASTSYMFAGICAFNKLTRPDANPMLRHTYGGKLYVQNQFCFRFDDLNQVGHSMRHGSGFTMMGLHAFQSPHHPFPQHWQSYWVQQVYQFFLELGFEPEKLHFNQDYWKGDSMGGRCLEFFYQGVELGNLVFVEDGRTESEDRYRILDVGLGFERILAARGADVPYLRDPLYDHLRSLLVGTHDGALCSKIGVGYAMRKLVQRIAKITQAPFDRLDGLLNQIRMDLLAYFQQDMSPTIPRLKRICHLQQQRMNQR